jgi:hypothetical protein
MSDWLWLIIPVVLFLGCLDNGEIDSDEVLP